MMKNSILLAFSIAVLTGCDRQAPSVPPTVVDATAPAVGADGKLAQAILAVLSGFSCSPRRLHVIRQENVRTVSIMLENDHGEDGSSLPIIPGFKSWLGLILCVQGDYTDKTRPYVCCTELASDSPSATTNTNRLTCFTLQLLDARKKPIGEKVVCAYSGMPVRVSLTSDPVSVVVNLREEPKTTVQLLGYDDCVPRGWRPVILAGPREN